jgi:hypothetical protein
MLKVQKKARVRGSSWWQAGSARGGLGDGGATWRGRKRASTEWGAAVRVPG